MSEGDERTEELRTLQIRLAAVEKELLWSTLNFSQALEQGHAAVYRRNFDEVAYEYMGDYIEQITGYRASEITPDIWDEIVLKAETQGPLAGLTLDACNQRVRSGAVDRWQADVLIRTRSGEERWVTDMSTVLRDDAGHCYGCLGILQDISERKEAESLLAATTQQLQRRNRRMEADLGLARQTQQALLPTAQPFFPNHPAPGQGALAFHQIYLPIEEVAGDLLAILPLSETRVGLFLCDVMGHGVRAALVSALVYALVQALASETTEPGDLMAELNRRYLACLSQDEVVFTTAFYAVADTRDRSLRFAVAGHPMPFHIHRAEAGVRPLVAAGRRTGSALGLSSAACFQTHHVALAPGDRVLLYTDGLFEVIDSGGDYYGLERLQGTLDRHRSADSASLLTHVLGEVREFGRGETFEDDVCLLLIDVS
jgi:sigma-B regulation protein RsbU (phosphoserine phosphatase)